MIYFIGLNLRIEKYNYKITILRFKLNGVTQYCQTNKMQCHDGKENSLQFIKESYL